MTSTRARSPAPRGRRAVLPTAFGSPPAPAEPVGAVRRRSPARSPRARRARRATAAPGRGRSRRARARRGGASASHPAAQQRGLPRAGRRDDQGQRGERLRRGAGAAAVAGPGTPGWRRAAAWTGRSRTEQPRLGREQRQAVGRSRVALVSVHHVDPHLPRTSAWHLAGGAEVPRIGRNAQEARAAARAPRIIRSDQVERSASMTLTHASTALARRRQVEPVAPP